MAKSAFASGFGVTCGVICAFIAASMFMMFLSCGGCAFILGTAVETANDANRRAEDARQKQAKSTPSTSDNQKQSDNKQGTNTTTTEPAGEREFDYVEILKLTGSGAKKSNTFTVKGEGAALAYSFRDDSGFGASIFAVTVHRASNNGLVTLAVNENGAGNSDTTRLRLSAGSYYLDVNAANCDWSISVQDYRDVTEQLALNQAKADLAAAAEAKLLEGVNQTTKKRRLEEKQSAEKAAADAEAKRLAEFKIWTSADGGFTVIAKMAGFAAGTVTLEKEDGSTIKVPLDQLGEADQQFVRDELKRR